MDSSAIACVAYHEAGHAVASFFQRRRFTSVSIVEDALALGRCSYPPMSEEFMSRLGLAGYDGEGARRLRPRLEAMMISGLAGHQADAQHCGAESPDAIAGSEADFAGAFRLASMLSDGDPDEAAAHVEYMRRSAIRYLRRPYWWRAVESLASELIERRELSAREAGAVIADSLRTQGLPATDSLSISANQPGSGRREASGSPKAGTVSLPRPRRRPPSRP